MLDDEPDCDHVSVNDEYRLRFSADLGTAFSASPPGHSDVTRVRDVLVCVNDPNVEIPDEEFEAHPPIAFFDLNGELTEPVELERGVRIDRLPHEESELVMHACTQRGHYFVPVRQFNQVYTFVRDVDTHSEEARAFRWDDSEGTLYDALSLSRLVRDNGYSTQYAGRITDYEDGEQRVMYRQASESDFVYRLRRDREWLDRAEGAELRNLLAAYWAATLPPRVRRAMWRMEWASWLRWADLIIPVLVSGLECLLKTEKHPATRQFKIRVSMLADAVGVEGVDRDLCDRMYNARSDWVHGSPVELFSREGGGPETDEQREVLSEVARLQDTLRGAVRLCIEDEACRKVFADDDAIRNRWRVPGLPGAKTRPLRRSGES
jgi:hypothetical protein